MIRWIVALVLLAASVAPVQAFAECACLPLRTFTPEERQQFETQYGIDWWKVMGRDTFARGPFLSRRTVAPASIVRARAPAHQHSMSSG